MNIQRIGNHRLPAPCRGSSGAAGYDICAAHNFTIHAGQRYLVPTGFAWQIPEGHVGLVRPRSGQAVREGLHVMAGVIDSDYRGEVKVLLVNMGERPVEIRAGDRIAQMLIIAHRGDALREVAELDTSDRGGNGFGSTGV